MATKTNKKKKQSKPKKRLSRKAAPRKNAAKKAGSTKKSAPARKSVPKKKKGLKKSKPRGKSENADTVVFEPKGSGPRSGGQSGDLQGLSNREGADSESVDELLEEGNAFEAEAVSGVEAADNEEGREVHTHEVPEDDVPEEYLDEK